MSLIQTDLRRWDFLADLVNKEKASWFVEVGCKDGRTTGHILKKCPGTRVVAIDPWTAMPENKAKGGETYADWDFAAIEKTFWENVGDDKDRCRMERNTSLEVAANWKRGPVGLVFIDAAHDFEHCCEDIDAWWPHVRPGGILAGHDYQHKFPTVMQAVARSFCLMDVGLGPDSVWFIRKMANSAIQEAA